MCAKVQETCKCTTAGYFDPDGDDAFPERAKGWIFRVLLLPMDGDLDGEGCGYLQATLANRMDPRYLPRYNAELLQKCVAERKPFKLRAIVCLYDPKDEGWEDEAVE